MPPPLSGVLLRRALALPQLNAAFQRVASNEGAPGSDGQSIAEFRRGLEDRLRALRYEVLSGRYAARPCLRAWLPRPNRKPRALAIPCVRDRVLQTSVAQVLTPLFEAEFEDCSFAYRQGRSVRHAVERISALQRQGYRWVVDADIEAFFDRIPRALLMKEVAGLIGEPRLLSLIEAWLAAGVVEDGVLTPTPAGVPQGSPISPLLANLYLDHLDEVFLEQDLVAVRYADDFIVLTKSRGRAEDALELTKETLARLHLKLNPVKTRIVSFDEGFKFLGWNFVRSLAVPAHAGMDSLADSAAPISKAADTSPPQAGVSTPPGVPLAGSMRLAMAEALQHDPDWKPRTQRSEPALEIRPSSGSAGAADVGEPSADDVDADGDDAGESRIGDDTGELELPALPAPGGLQRTLYVLQTGAELGKEGERLQVRRDSEILLELPVAQIDQVMLFGPVSLTTPAMQLCLRNRIPIALLSRMGRYYGRVDSQDFSYLRLQQAQLRWSADAQRTLVTARAMVQGKLENSALLLSRYGRHRDGAVAETCHNAAASIRELSRRLRTAADLDSLRGFEGAAAHAYFAAFVVLLNPDWSFPGRKRHPAPDPVNALLSLGYIILYQCVAGLIQARGLNPHLGIFHTGTGSHLALASDMMEEFRAVIVDACVLNLCLNGRFTRDQFRTAGGGCTLVADGARLFIRALEDKFNSMIIYPNSGQKLDMRRIIDAQVQLLCKAMRDPEETTYEPCVFR